MTRPLGDATLTMVNGGDFRLDGGAMHGVVPKTLWSRLVSCDEQNRCTYSTNCLLIEIGGEPSDCKVSSRDTNGAMCVFELTATNSGPRHLHHEQDEVVYVIDGEFEFEVAGKRFDGRCGDTIFLPRNVPHSWAAVDKPGRILNTYQPAGRMEEFFREVGRFSSPPIHEVLGVKGLLQLFQTHGMEMVQQLVPGWAVDDEGRITRTGA